MSMFSFPAADRANRRLAGAIMALMAAVLAHRFTGAPAFAAAEIVAMVAALALSVRSLGAREAYLAALSILAAAALIATKDAPSAALITGLEQAAFLMAFIYLLTLLHETAATSPSISACGVYLTSQPAGRRYGALFWGANVMAVLFNLGVVSLLTPLVQRGVAGRRLAPDLAEISERRQINALLRGFAFNVIWSPTALAPLAILELIDDVDRQRWTILGLGLTAIVSIAGWIEDRIAANRLLTGRRALASPPAFPKRAMGGFFAVVLWLFGLIWLISYFADETIAAGLMLACPILAFAWLRVQRAGWGEAVGAASTIATERLPRVAPVAATLAFSGFLGRVCAELTPAIEIVSALGLYAAPDWVLLSALPVLLAALSFLGVSPIMLAVFFGSLFGGLPEPPADATLLALAISCGWAMAMLVSPFATVVMLLAQQTERSALTVALRRNLAYAPVAAILMTAFFFFLTGGA